MFGLFFTSSTINNWEDVQLSKLTSYREFHLKMLNNGIYLPPSPYESCFISTMHTMEDIIKFSEVVDELV